MSRVEESALAPSPLPRNPARGTALIVPGYRGSGPAHWQSWLEAQVPGARRISGVDWDTPALAAWASAVRREIGQAPAPVWLVAHSFGCLAAVLAGTDRAERVAGALLVAPADPDRFTPAGLRPGSGQATPTPVTLSPYIPRAHLGFPSWLVASRNDPWMPLHRVRHWARLWGSELIDLGNAGHIDAESGFGPWPEGLALLRDLQKSRGSHPFDRTRAAVHRIQV